MSSNPRPTRTSAPVEEGTVMAQAEGAQSPQGSRILGSTWTEPALRAPTPSFKNYPHITIDRQGVLKDMAPLGTMPSSRIKKAAAVKSDGPKQIIITKNADASVALSPREISTPEPTVSPVRRRSESRKADDAEWAPRTPIAQTSGRKSAARSSITAHSVMQEMSPSMSASMSASPSKQDRQRQRTDQVIDSACSQALEANKYPTAYALRSLYNDHRANARIVTLFEKVFSKRADETEQTEFRTLMTFKKKEGKKGGKAGRYFQEHGNTVAAGSLFSRSYSLATPSKRSAAPESPRHASRTPHKEPGHISKKHKGNMQDEKSELESKGAPVTDANMAALNNGEAAGRRRAKSLSSNGSSALSSLDEDLIREDFAPSESTSHSHSHANKSTTSTSELQHAHATTLVHNRAEPITASKTLGPKLHAFPTTAKSATPASSSTPSHTRQAVEAIMPSAYPPPPSSDLHPASASASVSSSRHTPSSLAPAHHVTVKSHKKAAAASAGPRRLDGNDQTVQLRRKAREITDYLVPLRDSFERETPSRIRYPSWGSSHESLDLVALDDETGTVTVVGRLPAKSSSKSLRLRSNQANRKAHDDFDDLSSSTLLSPLPDLKPASAANSRAGTLNVPGRPARKAKTGGLRTKTSPMKNRAGPSAGIPRASGERHSPVGNGHGQEDNDDYCSSCGGNGDLVCCDGCTRSFHFKCVDPPIVEGQLPDTWFCNKCNMSRNPPMREATGPFGELLLDLETRNPSAFHLPKYIRDYFEGVRTGTEGEYEEGPLPPKTRYHRSGFDEAPDYMKLKDNKGNFISCHHCQGGPTTKGPVISCGYCSLQWHLDCLDPPLANPPPPGRPWRCPCHVDDLLLKVPGALGPAHRFRRIKGASVIKPAIARGVKNNGHIEIEFAPSEDEDEGFFEQKEFGHVYKLPEEGIKLDFISKCRSLSNLPRSSSQVPSQTRNTRIIDFTRQQVKEQQAALNLAQLAKAVPDGTQMLIDAIMTEASPSLIDLIAQGDAEQLAGNLVSSSRNEKQRNKQSLLAMKALIEAQLQQVDSEDIDMDMAPPRDAAEQKDEKPVTEESMYDAIVEKAEEEALNDSMEV